MTDTEGGLYRARLGEAAPRFVRHYISSMGTDVHFLEQEVRSSEAHALALLKQGIIDRSEARAILKALEELLEDHKRELTSTEGYEDIHEFVECYVIAKAGEAGKKLHTGRSRNDQVATITRMKVREGLLHTADLLIRLTKTLLRRAGREIDVPLIYYTHLQHAQIGSLGHYWLAQAESFLRDLERLLDAYTRVNRSPLGASACAGSRLNIDREFTAQLLGFDALIENSLDAVTTRDFVFETLAVLANLMINVSRVCKDLILWSSPEFNYVALSEKYASTSSVMPHKKNPDTLELAKARCGEVMGLLVAVGNILEGLPSGYNRELQLVKPPIHHAFQIVCETLVILREAISTLRANTNRIRESLETTEAYAVELVEWLVDAHRVPLRTAHSVIAKVMRTLAKRRRNLRDVDPRELSGLLQENGLSITIDGALSTLLDPIEILHQRKTRGSPHPSETRRQLESISSKIRQFEALIRRRREALSRAEQQLRMQVASALAIP